MCGRKPYVYDFGCTEKIVLYSLIQKKYDALLTNCHQVLKITGQIILCKNVLESIRGKFVSEDFQYGGYRFRPESGLVGESFL